jgi:histidinol phosphatase-like enzyme
VVINTDKAIFLDRDGIINRATILDGKPYAATRLKDVFVVEGIKDLIKRWHDENYLVFVVSNQK